MYCHRYGSNASLYFTGQLQHQAVAGNVELGSTHVLVFFKTPPVPLPPTDVLYCHVVDRETHINKICAVWSAWCIVNYAAALSHLRQSETQCLISQVSFKSCGRNIDLCIALLLLLLLLLQECAL